MKTKRILAIDPGTRLMGVAILEGRELLYYGVKTIRRPKSPREILAEASRIIQNLIAYYQPTLIVIEKTFLIQKSASLLMVLAEEIKNQAQRSNLQVFEYAPTYVREYLCQPNKATKRETAKKIARCFPELRTILHRSSAFEERYYSNLFSAVALALVWYEENLSRKTDSVSVSTRINKVGDYEAL
jgi:Holliday junction resolvasome RuvABC endonuclease subunit